MSGGVKEVIDVIMYEIIRDTAAQLGDTASSYDLQEYLQLQDIYNFTVLANTFHFKNVYN